MNSAASRSLETAGMMMIGDGLLAAIEPRRHMRLWQGGPKPWREMVGYFADRPLLTAGMGVAEVALGVALARYAATARRH